MFNKKITLVVLGTAFTFLPLSSQAYGPEGMFGGRMNPDNTYTIDMPVTTETGPARGQTVLNHPRPDYDPKPFNVGSFNVYPSLETSATYDSNIFASTSGAKSDFVYEARPTIAATSNWNRHALSILTFGGYDFYGNHSDENFSSAVFLAQGRVDIMQDTWLALRGGAQHLINPRGSANAVSGTEPTSFDVYNAGMSAYRGVGIIKAQVDYDYKRLSYDDTPSVSGTILTSANDRDEHTVSAKVSYDHSGNIKPYVRVGLNRRTYDNTSNRNSHGWQADAGVDADFGGIVFLNAYAGWLEQDYSNFGASETNNGVDFGGRLTWNVTGLTSVILDANRSVEEDPFSSFNSFMATGGSLTVVHELRRNILLEGDLSYTHDSFQGASSQTQEYIGAGGGLRWLINQNFYSDLVYNYQERSTSNGFTRNLVTLRLNMRL